MKRQIFKVIFLILVLIIILPVTVHGEELDIFAMQSEAVDTDSLYNPLSPESLEILDDIKISETLTVDDAVGKTLVKSAKNIREYITAGLRSACVQLTIIILCSVGTGVFDTMGNDAGKHFVPMVGALTLTAVSIGSVDALIGLGGDAISEMSSFSKLLLPSIAACAGAAGAPTAAVTKQLASALFSDILITVMEKLLLPSVYVYITLSVANSCMEIGHLERISGFIKRAVSWILVAILSAFTGYITLTGIVSGTVDSFSVKAAKSVVSAVPVVGSVMSNASETIIAGAAILKNAVGVFGTAATIAVCAAPCIRMAVQYVFFKISSAVSSIIGDESLVELLDALGGAVGLVLGMTSSCALMVFISIISAVSVVC